MATKKEAKMKDIISDKALADFKKKCGLDAVMVFGLKEGVGIHVNSDGICLKNMSKFGVALNSAIEALMETGLEHMTALLKKKKDRLAVKK
jgi:hypothetical protein